VTPVARALTVPLMRPPATTSLRAIQRGTLAGACPARPHTMRAHASTSSRPRLPVLPPTPDHLALAHAVADAAAAVTTRYFRSPLPIDSKADASPVTIADRQAEAAARALLGREVPGHAVYGEEGGMTLPRAAAAAAGGAGGEYLWVIDPIDGTKSFITGQRREREGRGRASLTTAPPPPPPSPANPPHSPHPHAYLFQASPSGARSSPSSTGARPS
jgi:hypothetical protein